MHQCTHCQADLADNAQFCARCGAPVEENQPHSAHLDEVNSHEEKLETTSKQPAVTVPATPPLPTLRTRRMHPNSSIPEFPQAPWLPAGSIDEDENRADGGALQDKQSTSSPILQLPLTPQLESEDVFSQTQAPSEEPATRASMQLAQAETSFSPIIDAPALSTFSAATPDDVSTSPTGELVQVAKNIAIAPEDISASPTGELTHMEDISASPTSELAQVSPASAAKSDDISATSADELKYTSPFPPPTPERKSTPRPATPIPQTRQAKKSTSAGRTRALIIAVIVVLIVLAGGAGAFALIHQNPSTGATAQCSTQQTNCIGGSSAQVHGKPTRLTFSGAVAGPMSVVAKPRCQISTAGNLRVLTLNLSGTINNQLYNFSFVIEHYSGPGTYSNSTATTTILFDVPGQSTTNGWSNSTPTDNGSITVERGEQTGSISYTLSGVGTQARTQMQASGNWTCGN